VDTLTGRVTSRTNRRGHQTTYAYNAFGGVNSTTINMSSTSDTNIVTHFCAAETRSLHGCAWGPATAVGGVPLPQAVTRVDGPRGGLVDVMVFHLNRFGGPDTIQNPLGGRTRISRNAEYPALVTRIVDPMGFEQRAWYDTLHRGLVVRTQTPGLDSADATVQTEITWHSHWALPTKIKPPLGAATHFSYDSSVAKLNWQRVGPNDSTKVSFTYDAKHRVTSVVQPGGTETYEYDAVLGNVQRTQVATTVTHIKRDRWGADSVTFDGDTVLTTTSYRNILGRVDSTRSVGAPVSYQLPQGEGAPLAGSSPSVRRVVRNF